MSKKGDGEKQFTIHDALDLKKFGEALFVMMRGEARRFDFVQDIGQAQVKIRLYRMSTKLIRADFAFDGEVEDASKT